MEERTKNMIINLSIYNKYTNKRIAIKTKQPIEVVEEVLDVWNNGVVPEYTDDQIIDGYVNSDMTVAQLSVLGNKTPVSIYRLLRRNNVTLDRGTSKYTVSMFEELREEGDTQTSLGERAGTTGSNVCMAYKREGIPWVSA